MSSLLALHTNSASIGNQRQIARHSREMATSIQQLSSGERINSAADDAAGIAVSEGLRAHRRGLEQAYNNANDAISLVSTAESAYGTISDLLIRGRELAIQAATDTLTKQERLYLNQEFKSVIKNIDKIKGVTEFNGIKLLSGKAGKLGLMRFQVGAESSIANAIFVELKSQGTADLNVAGLTIGDLKNAQKAIIATEKAMFLLGSDRAELGAAINQLQQAANLTAQSSVNLTAAESNISDTDFSSASAHMTKNRVLLESGVAMQSQANALPNMALRLLA
jgi:flagellin